MDGLNSNSKANQQSIIIISITQINLYIPSICSVWNWQIPFPTWVSPYSIASTAFPVRLYCADKMFASWNCTRRCFLYITRQSDNRFHHSITISLAPWADKANAMLFSFALSLCISAVWSFLSSFVVSSSCFALLSFYIVHPVNNFKKETNWNSRHKSKQFTKLRNKSSCFSRL